MAVYISGGDYQRQYIEFPLNKERKGFYGTAVRGGVIQGHAVL